MIIWTLAILLFGMFGLMGFSLGAIRLSSWLLGLIFGALLARPLGHFFNPILALCGLKNPVLIWLLGPFLAFLVIQIAFQVIGLVVHQKVDVYYKYKAGDLKMGLFNRLNQRLGICVGMLNASVYLILISWVIFIFSYWTTQMVNSDTTWSVKLLNSAGKNVQDSGMSKVAAAIDHMPEGYYQTADIAGLIYHNDLLEGRLSRYPAFLAIGERPEFQDIGSDQAFTELRQKQPPISEILDNSKIQAIMNNPDFLKEIWALFQPNLTDLQNYLKSGQSAKYDDEKILGRWDFDLSGALNLLKRSKPNIGFLEMQRTRQIMGLAFTKTTFVATPEPDKLAFLKEVGKVHPAPKPNQAPTVEHQSFKGNWSSEGGKYQLTFADKPSSALEAVIDGDKMTITGDTYPMVFERQ